MILLRRSRYTLVMRSPRRPGSRLVALMTAMFVLASAAYALAQFRSRGLDILGVGAGLAPPQFPDADFVICRLVYTEVRRYGNGWRTDYPLGERNLSIRFGELTRTRVSGRTKRIAQPLPGPPERQSVVRVSHRHGWRRQLGWLQPVRCHTVARVHAEGRVCLD